MIVERRWGPVSSRRLHECYLRPREKKQRFSASVGYNSSLTFLVVMEFNCEGQINSLWASFPGRWAAWREKEGELVIATLTACENIRFSSLFVAGDVLRGEERGAGQLQLRLWNWNSTSLVAPRGLSCQICPSLSFPPRRQSAPESLLAGVQN